MTGDRHQQAPAPQDMPSAGALPVLDQDFDGGSLFMLRAAVAAHATQAGFAERRAGDIVLAVHELAANAIRHGAGHGRLLITEHDGALRCQVTDDGAAQAASAGTAPPPTTATSGAQAPWPSEKGHGLWVVRQVADHLSEHSGPGGTSITASFTLPPPGQQPPGPGSPWDRQPAPGQSPPR